MNRPNADTQRLDDPPRSLALYIVPPDMMSQLGQAKVVITNFHGFLRREKVKAGKLTKGILDRGTTGISSAFTESEGEMARRLCCGPDATR